MSENKRGPVAVIVGIAGAVLGTIELVRTAGEFFESGAPPWWLVLVSIVALLAGVFVVVAEFSEQALGVSVGLPAPLERAFGRLVAVALRRPRVAVTVFTLVIVALVAYIELMGVLILIDQRSCSTCGSFGDGALLVLLMLLFGVAAAVLVVWTIVVPLLPAHLQKRVLAVILNGRLWFGAVIIGIVWMAVPFAWLAISERDTTIRILSGGLAFAMSGMVWWLVKVWRAAHVKPAASQSVSLPLP